MGLWIHLCRPGYTYVALDTLMSPWIHMVTCVMAGKLTAVGGRGDGEVGPGYEGWQHRIKFRCSETLFSNRICYSCDL